MRNLSAVAATAASVLVLALGGCSTGGDAVASCDAAVAGIQPIEQLDGLFLMVSLELAETLRECPTPEAWTDALRAHPEVLSLDVLSAAEAEEYLAQACSFLDGSPAICANVPSVP